MEPERKIEKLLRACAKKRRADGGDAFKLHPATRRLLQGEVVRRAPMPRGEKETLWQLLRKWWPGALGFALVVCLGAALFWPVLQQSKTASKHVEAMSSAKSLGAVSTIAAVDNNLTLPATLGAPTNQLAFAPARMDAVSGPPAGYVAGGGVPSVARSNDLITYSRAKTDDRATLFADSAEQQRRDEFSVPTNRGQSALALAENAPGEKAIEPSAPVVAAAVPPSAPPGVGGEPVVHADTANRAAAFAPGSVASVLPASAGLASAASSRELKEGKMALAQNAQKFKSELSADPLPLGVKNSQRFTQTRTKKIPPVLAAFEVQQNGSTIAVVDRDGSIYKGSMQPVGLVRQNDLSKTPAAADKTAVAQAANKDLDLAGNSPATAQNYFFRVSGANRSLKQNVVFSGNLIAISNLAANAAQNFGGGGGAGGQIQSADAKVAQQPSFSNSRITGTVTLGRTNQMEINAMPVNP